MNPSIPNTRRGSLFSYGRYSVLVVLWGAWIASDPCEARGSTVEAESVAPIYRHGRDGVTDWIARGREALEAGRAAEAQKIFEEAAAKDQNSLRTRTWVLRSWMDQGRINDSLDAIDELAKGGAKGPAVDYLYGMAFARKARGYMQTNVAGGPVQMALDDAVQYLDRAVKADPELARDAFLPLAEAAWYGQKLDIARSAAETAVKVKVEVELRGVLSFTEKDVTILVKETEFNPAMLTEVQKDQKWSLELGGSNRLRKQAQRLHGKTVIVKGSAVLLGVKTQTFKYKGSIPAIYRNPPLVPQDMTGARTVLDLEHKVDVKGLTETAKD
jgi:tetratricopeptide (TPR) repeat protein